VIDNLNLKGIRKMKDDLTRLRSLLRSSIETSLEDEASSILQNSKDNYVPVASGELRDSGEISAVEWSGGVATITIRYTARHAVPVHENPSQHDPPTWEGKQIEWHPSGRGPKYLEMPLREAEKGMMDRIGERVFP